MTPPSFINKKNQTLRYFNANIKILYCNIIFRLLILNIDCNNMMNFLDRKNDKFASHYQNILAVKESHNYFGEMYLGGKKMIIYDDLIIVTNKRIYHHMDAAEFKRLFYKNLSENTFKNQKN